MGQSDTLDTNDIEMTEEQIKKENDYLNKNVFYGLTNLNDGFDSEDIKYFSETDFRVVLDRVKKLGLGINGIEPWKSGEFYGVLVYEQITDDPTDSDWYEEAFKFFREKGDTLLYAATYYIPDELMK